MNSMRELLLVGAFVAAGPCIGAGASAAEFHPPERDERLRAIGPTEGLDETLRRALDPGDDFKPIPAPRPMDWLASHREAGQTFEDFQNLKPARPRPTAARRTIFILPLGEFPEGLSPPLENLREFTSRHCTL